MKVTGETYWVLDGVAFGVTVVFGVPASLYKGALIEPKVVTRSVRAFPVRDAHLEFPNFHQHVVT